MCVEQPIRRTILLTSFPTALPVASRGSPIGSTRWLVLRWLQPEGLPLLRTAYIDAVATLPADQGQGIGSTVMRHLATVIADFEIACLQTERVSFYARLGWEVWRGPLAGRRATELLPTPDQKGVMILRLARTPPLDIDRLLVIEYAGRIW